MDKIKVRITASDYSRIQNAAFEPEIENKPEFVKQCFGDRYFEIISPNGTMERHRITKDGYFQGGVGIVRNRHFEYNGEDYDVTLQIHSRFDKDDKAYFLSAMLLSDDELENMFKNERVATTEPRVFEILLLYLFQIQLEAAAAKGIYRRYVRFENNDSRPHGIIDISRHIKENGSLNNGKVAYNYRELTANNYINKLILAAYGKLKIMFPALTEKHIESKFLPFFKQLNTEIDSSNIDIRHIVSNNLDPITHPFYHEYEALRKTCLKILRDEGVSIFGAECCDEVDSLLVYIPELWEKYLEKYINKVLPERLSLRAQAEKKYRFGEHERKAIPDFVFYRGNEPIAILDAKFKPWWKNCFIRPASLSDKIAKEMAEDRKKCYRDMAVFNAESTGVIFPCNEPEPTKEKPKTMLKEGIVSPHFYMSRIIIPQIADRGFPDWYTALDTNVTAALKEYLTDIEQ